jgi:hypothetical protein
MTKSIITCSFCSFSATDDKNKLEEIIAQHEIKCHPENFASFEDIVKFIVKKYNLPEQITDLSSVQFKIVVKAFMFGRCLNIAFEDGSILSIKSVMEYEDLEAPEIDTDLNHYIMTIAYNQLRLFKRKALPYSIGEYLDASPMFREYKTLYAQFVKSMNTKKEKEEYLKLKEKYGGQQ